jgi:hypothetical protein
MSEYYQCKLQKPMTGNLSSTSYFIQNDLSSSNFVEESIQWVDINKAYVGNKLNNGWSVIKVYKLVIRTIERSKDGIFKIIDSLC